MIKHKGEGITNSNHGVYTLSSEDFAALKKIPATHVEAILKHAILMMGAVIPAKKSQGGASFAAALIIPQAQSQQVYAVNLGNGAVILEKSGQYMTRSRPHDTTCPNEAERLHLISPTKYQSKASVTANQIQGIYNTRHFGQLCEKRNVMTFAPDSCMFELKPQSELILATSSEKFITLESDKNAVSEKVEQNLRVAFVIDSHGEEGKLIELYIKTLFELKLLLSLNVYRQIRDIFLGAAGNQFSTNEFKACGFKELVSDYLTLLMARGFLVPIMNNRQEDNPVRMAARMIYLSESLYLWTKLFCPETKTLKCYAQKGRIAHSSLLADWTAVLAI